MKVKTLEENLLEAEQRIVNIEERVRSIDNDIESTSKRLMESKERLDTLQPQYEQARKKRQAILAKKEDPDKVSSEIIAIKAEIELKEDETIGLTDRLERLQGEEAKLLEDLIEARKEIPRTRLIHAAERYNKIASTLAEVVKEIWKYRIELNETNEARNITVASPSGWGGALQWIPKLFLPEEVPTQSYQNRPDLTTFFDFQGFYEEKKEEEREKYQV